MCKVLRKEFCEALQTKLLYCFIGSRFWKIFDFSLLEKVSAKVSFLVKLHSVISNNIKIEPHHRCCLSYILFLEKSKIYAKHDSTITRNHLLLTHFQYLLAQAHIPVTNGHAQKQTFRKRRQKDS